MVCVLFTVLSATLNVYLVRFEMFYSAHFVEPYSRICLQQPLPGIFAEGAKFCLLGINNFFFLSLCRAFRYL